MLDVDDGINLRVDGRRQKLPNLETEEMNVAACEEDTRVLMGGQASG